MSQRIASLKTAIPLLAVVLLPACWLFGPALVTDQTFAFRDAAHFYHPLFAWTGGEWQAGRVPLWNPLENTGSPVLADTTSSVLYPGKLLLALPLGDFATKYELYILAHVVLAAWSCYRLARHGDASPPAAALAALAYAYGGSVLFQYCNVVFLVGAAWLPLALLAADRLLTKRTFCDAIWLGVVLALMILGGDPQTAYHAGLLAGLYAVVRSGRCSPAPRSRLSEAGLSVLLLAAAALTAAALAAIQILPAAEWTKQSDRAAFDFPRNVYEIPACLRERPDDCGSAVAKGLLGRPAPNTHHDFIYHFSVGPWRWAELIWPNVFGQTFPVHHRWSTAFPAEGRCWSPSLYLGLLPLVLALRTWRLRSASSDDASRRVTWLSWTALLAVLGSLGWFGVGWLIQEVRCSLFGADPRQPWLGEPVGGVYWLMVVALPNYACFRFPAKLFGVAQLAISLLAAHGWDRVFATQAAAAAATREPISEVRRWLVRLGSASLVAVIGALLTQSSWRDWLATARPDFIFGPLDATGAWRDALLGTLQTLLLCGVFYTLLSRWERKPTRWVPLALLAITAAELTWAHRWFVPTVASHELTAPAAFWAASTVPRSRIFRGAEQNWVPSDWPRTSSSQRLAEVVRWDRQTLFPKYGLAAGVSLVEAHGTLMSRDYLAFLRVARERGPRRWDDLAEPHLAALESVGAKYLLLPAEGAPLYDRATRVPADSIEHSNATVWQTPAPLPRAWIVHEVHVLPELHRQSSSAVEDRQRMVLFPNGQPRDFRRQAVVETDAAWENETGEPGDDSCELTDDSPCQVTIDARLRSPGLLVMGDLFYPGWNAYSQSADGDERRLPVYRTNRIQRGVPLPAGAHRIVFRYEPRSFWRGAGLSAIAWILVAGCATWFAGRGCQLAVA